MCTVKCSITHLGAVRADGVEPRRAFFARLLWSSSREFRETRPKEMLEKCCPDYVKILEDRTYGQVYKPLTGTYCPACGPDKPCPTGQTCTSSGLGRKLRFGFSGGDGCCILDTS